MNAWKNGSVVKRLYAVLTLIGLVVAGQMVLGYVQQWRSHQTLDTIVNTEYQRMRAVSEWELLSTGTTVRIVALNRGNDPGLASLFGPEIGPRIEKIDAALAGIKTWASDPEQVAILGEIDATGPLIMAALGKIASFREAGDTEAAVSEFETGFMPSVNKYQEGIARFSKLQGEKLAARTLEQQDAQEQNFWLSLGITAVIVVFAAGLIVGLARHIRHALDRATLMAETVAGGDLKVRSGSTAGDEFGHLMRAMDGMAESLSVVVGRVRSSTAHLKDASGEIAQGNQDLSERTERQASHLQQTAVTMADLTEAVRHTADNAGEAARLADQARQVADHGGEMVGRVVDTMSRIEQSSKRIEEIISVIDGISFQTNILALNAAVEAARAGEQGRGFAVVAAEVRNLAQRSAAAAKEIKSLIVDSSEKVRDGGEQVDAAGKNMKELVQSVNQVSQLIADISKSTSSQRTGIAEVGASVSEIDRSTQQNAALVEEAAAAAGSMRSQALQLDEAVMSFKL